MVEPTTGVVKLEEGVEGAKKSGAMVLKEGVESAEKGLEIADQVLDIRAKYEKIKDEKYFRELKLLMEKISIIERRADVGINFADKTMDLFIKGVDAKEKHQAEKNLRRDEERQRELELRMAYFDAAVKRGLVPNSTVITGFEDVWNKVSEEESKENPKDHGSKVKEGVFAECSIEMFDDKAGIIVNRDKQEVVMLTRDNILSCKFVKSKKRGIKLQTYYYYHITFHDGQKCQARMRKKYRNAMLSSMIGIDEIPSGDLE